MYSSLVPRPSTHVKTVWYSEQYFLSHGRGQSQIWDHQSDCRRPNHICM